MRKSALDKINAIDRKIDARRRQRDEIQSKEWEREKLEEERKWKKDNLECIELCKGLLGKAFTFGDSVIRHHQDKRDGVVTREYDFVDIYFATKINYRDKSRVCMSLRHIYNSGNYGTYNDNYDLCISLNKRGNDWMADECGRDFLGKLHVLTEKELNDAVTFWQTRMREITRDEFTTPVDNGWCCPRLTSAGA